MSEDPRESLRLLARALALNPRNEAAHEGIRWARRRLLGDARAPAWRAMQRAGLEPAARGIDSVAAGPAASAFPAPVREERHSRQQTYERLALLARITIVASLTLTVLLSAATAWLLLQPVPEPGVTLVAAASAEAAEVAPLELPEARPPAQPRPFNRAEVYAARVAALTRQVDVTWAEQDWDQSALLLAQALAFQPGDPMLTRKLVATYFNGAVALRRGARARARRPANTGRARYAGGLSARPEPVQPGQLERERANAA
jgi:hypothetical protein